MSTGKQELRMSIADAKKHFTRMLRKLSAPLTITRHGEPVAIILSLNAYRKLLRIGAYEDILLLRKQVPKDVMSAAQAHRLSRKELEQRGDPYRH